MKLKGKRMAHEAIVSRDMTREARGAIIWDMRRNQKMTNTEIGEEFGLSRVRICQEFKFYIETPEGMKKESDFMAKKAEIANKKKMSVAERQEARIKERNDKAIRILSGLIDGKTVKEVADSEKLSVSRIHGIINQYEKVNPELVSKYREVASKHRFGWNKRSPKVAEDIISEAKDDINELLETAE